MAKARQMVPRVEKMKLAEHNRRTVIQFIETAIIAQFPHWSREEVEKMLGLTDLRKTKVYKEALEEGLTQGRKENQEASAVRLHEMGLSAEMIAHATGLTLAEVRKLLKGRKPSKS